MPQPHSAPSAGLQAAFCTDAWFASCPEGLPEVLLELGSQATLANGEPLFERGSGSDALYCVTAGALRIEALQRDGSQALLGHVEPYQWFGEISLIDGLPRTHAAVAEGDTRVWRVPGAALRVWLDAHPRCWRDIARLACAKLRVTMTVLEGIAHSPLEQRLAKRLWLVATGHGSRAGVPRRQVRLPQEQLALMLGVTRQTANKALRAFEDQGIVALRYGTIELVDVESLIRAAGRD